MNKKEEFESYTILEEDDEKRIIQCNKKKEPEWNPLIIYETLISEFVEDLKINFIVHKTTNIGIIKDRAKLLIIKYEEKLK